MTSGPTPDKPIWEGFALLGLRLARSLTEIAETQTKRIENTVTARADAFYARQAEMAGPRGRAMHTISALFDDVMDRLRNTGEQE